MSANQQFRFAFLIGAVLACQVITAQDQEEPLPSPEIVQKKIEKWVETKKTISAERSKWETQEATLKDLNQIRQRESAQLEEFALAAKERVSELAKRRDEFAKEEQELKAWRKKLESEVGEFERRVQPLLAQFPPPLRAKVDEAAIRLEAADESAPLQNRIRDVLLLVQAWQEFHNTITADSELREIDGQKREVKLLYFGMTQAFYVDASGRHAGYGIPSGQGWQWTEEKALAPKIQLAIDVHARSETPQFVRLPIVSSPSASE